MRRGHARPPARPIVIVIAALIVAAAILVAAQRVARAPAAPPPAGPAVDPLRVIEVFAPGIAAVQHDPRALLVWQPLARTARQLYEPAFEALDRASGSAFPFAADQIDAAHARWTADWLAWEGAHDAEFKLKAAAIEQELASAPSVAGRTRLDALEREKLETYQRRYQEYVRVAKALQGLATSARPGPS